MGAPYSYNEINLATAPFTPSTIHVTPTACAAYYRRYLLQRAFSVYKWTIPEHWNLDYILHTLYTFGFFAVVNTDKFGVIPQQCGLYGYDVYYQPTHAVISNPRINSTLMPAIGINCELIKLQSNYTGIIDKVSWYADLLALSMESLTANLINSKLSYVMFAQNKATAESLKKMYDTIARGEPAVVVDQTLRIKDNRPWEGFEQNISQNFIADKLLESMRNIENMFDTDIGINNANTGKRERMIVDEVNANNEEIYTTAQMWLENLKAGCEKVNKMFGLSIDVNWRNGGERNDTRDIVDTRAI